jgi:hypothetical protein
MEDIERAAAGLHEAVEAGKFALAQKTAAVYARLVAEQARALAPGDPEAVRLCREALEVLASALETTRARRSELTLRSNALRPLRAYLQNQNLERRP